jgi:hypothetical protein
VPSATAGISERGNYNPRRVYIGDGIWEVPLAEADHIASTQSVRIDGVWEPATVIAYTTGRARVRVGDDSASYRERLDDALERGNVPTA